MESWPDDAGCSHPRGDLEAVKILLRQAQMWTSSGRMATAISMAAEEGHTDVVNLLLEAGAEVDLPDDDGFTALGSACENGHSRPPSIDGPRLRSNHARLNAGRPHHSRV